MKTIKEIKYNRVTSFILRASWEFISFGSHRLSLADKLGTSSITIASSSSGNSSDLEKNESDRCDAQQVRIIFLSLDTHNYSMSVFHNKYSCTSSNTS